MLTNVIRKEIKELLTPATVLPVIVMFFIFAGMGNFIGGLKEKAMEKPKIALVCNDDGNITSIFLKEIKERCEVVYEGNLSNAYGIKGDAIVEIPYNFSYLIEQGKKAKIIIHWLISYATLSEAIPYENLMAVIKQAENKIIEEISHKYNMNASFFLNPVDTEEHTIFRGKEIDLPPSAILRFFSSQSTTLPIVIMIIIIISGGMVISSMGMEKENKTLETLLSMPIKRRDIIAGKIIGSAVVGLVIAMIYMAGFSYYINSFYSEVKIDYFKLNAFDYFLISLSVFSSLFSALSMCIVFGAFAKSYKSAQTLSLPISSLAIFPMFVIMFKDFFSLPLSLKILIFAIPFSHPMMAPRFLLLNEYGIVFAGIIYSFIFSLIFIIIAVYIFKTDLLITGRIRK